MRPGSKFRFPVNAGAVNFQLTEPLSQMVSQMFPPCMSLGCGLSPVQPRDWIPLQGRVCAGSRGLG